MERFGADWKKLVRIYFDEKPLGGAISEIDCRISQYTVPRPDVSIFLGEKWKGLDFTKIPATVAPDIAVEVVSTFEEHAQNGHAEAAGCRAVPHLFGGTARALCASEQVTQMTRKVREYLEAGVKEIWLLDWRNEEAQVRTKATIRLLQVREVLESSLLPGFSVSVAGLLARP